PGGAARIRAAAEAAADQDGREAGAGSGVGRGGAQRRGSLAGGQGTAPFRAGQGLRGVVGGLAQPGSDPAGGPADDDVPRGDGRGGRGWRGADAVRASSGGGGVSAEVGGAGRARGAARGSEVGGAGAHDGPLPCCTGSESGGRGRGGASAGASGGRGGMGRVRPRGAAPRRSSAGRPALAPLPRPRPPRDGP